MTDICQQCGNEYERIGTHWAMSSRCNHPSFSNHQREIITGLLMGDGWIDGSNNRNPRLRAEMTSVNYLKYVDKAFGVFGHGVSMKRTAEDSAENARKSGFNLNARPENYSDVYVWQLMAHPELEEFENWYQAGEKVWPNNINLTPTVLKHWYCGDGCWNNTHGQNRIEISMPNEREHTDKVDQIFENVGLPKPSNYSAYGPQTGKNSGLDAVFTVEDSKELWEYMGEPLPDFEYKWPEEYRKT